MKKLVSVAILMFALSNLFAGTMPRPEYPRPQFEREDWMNLNGEWEYILDPVKTGWENNYAGQAEYEGKITVPFCPESKLSGVAHTDFIPCIWYRRQIEIPAQWSGKQILLNFGAVYYESEIWIDSKFVSRHIGGSDSFSVDITPYVKAGQTHSLVVVASSDPRTRLQTAGKQALQSNSFICSYTRTTGIWQTVWMEAVSKQHLKSVTVTPDVDNSAFVFRVGLPSGNHSLTISIFDNGKKVASYKGRVSDGCIIPVTLRNPKLWSPGNPFLYDIEYELKAADGSVSDKVRSYAGMRKISIEGNKVMLNNKPLYQRLVLDQGFYPDGIWTAPSDEALKNDIQLAMQAGFNGARLHQKVFEERFYYWADRLGYLTWGEMPSWGMDANDPVAQKAFLAEWLSVVAAKVNHPSIVAWVPLNEEWWPDQKSYPFFVENIYKLTKLVDPSRPLNTVSGGVCIAGATDIFTVHNYAQKSGDLISQLIGGGKFFSKQPSVTRRARGNVGFNFPVEDYEYPFGKLAAYDGEMPYMIDEFGGVKCVETTPDKDDGSWGYGDAAKTREEFYAIVKAQVDVLIANSDSIWGYCYTQLTDVEQEQNGLYYYDRSPKFETELLYKIFSAQPEHCTGQTRP